MTRVETGRIGDLGEFEVELACFVEGGVEPFAVPVEFVWQKVDRAGEVDCRVCIAHDPHWQALAHAQPGRRRGLGRGGGRLRR